MIVTKVKFDARSQQFVRTVKDGQLKYRLFGSLTDAMPMVVLGKAAIDSIKSRVSKGVGSNDYPMPPLRRNTSAVVGKGKVVKFRKSYPDYKAAKGFKPIRDLYGIGNQGGHMLDNISLRSVSQSEARIDITSAKQRVKAAANERRAPWWGLSPKDMAFLVQVANKLFKQGVAQVGGIFRGQRPVRRAA